MRFLILVLPILFLACGSAEEPEPTPVVLQTEGNPTSTPFPAMECIGGDVVQVGTALQCRPYTPQPQIIVATPLPTLSLCADGDTLIKQQAEGRSTFWACVNLHESPVQPAETATPTTTPPETAEPTPAPTPVPLPTLSPTPIPLPTPPGPTPRPTARYRSVGTPDDLGDEGFVFSDGPRASSLDITFSATVEANRYTEPTEIQVWQSIRRDDNDDGCSTERPIAFIAKPRGGTIYIPASTTYEWTYCTSLGARPRLYSQKIPWLAAEVWTYSKRSRSKNYDPFITDITVHINLRDDRVDDLRYSSSEGYIILIFDDNRLLARAWVEAN